MGVCVCVFVYVSLCLCQCLCAFVCTFVCCNRLREPHVDTVATCYHVLVACAHPSELGCRDALESKYEFYNPTGRLHERGRPLRDLRYEQIDYQNLYDLRHLHERAQGSLYLQMHIRGLRPLPAILRRRFLPSMQSETSGRAGPCETLPERA